MGLIKKNDISYGCSKNLTAGDGIEINGDTVSVNNEVAITSDVANGVRLFATGVPINQDSYYIQLSTGSDRDVGGIKDKAVAINFCAGSKQMVIAGYKWNAESPAGNKWENLFLLDCEDTGWKTLTGDYFDVRYRKKNSIVYVTWHYPGIKQALVAKTSATNCTLPEGFRPTETIYTTVVDSGSWNKGSLGIQANGAMRFAYEQAIAQGAGTMFGSLSYPV